MSKDGNAVDWDRVKECLERDGVKRTQSHRRRPRCKRDTEIDVPVDCRTPAIDVHTNGKGLRSCANSDGDMVDLTGIPAAASAVLMTDGRVSRKGVFAPEVINPAEFFLSLRKASPGGGGFILYRLEGGKPENRMRMRSAFF